MKIVVLNATIACHHHAECLYIDNRVGLSRSRLVAAPWRIQEFLGRRRKKVVGVMNDSVETISRRSLKAIGKELRRLGKRCRKVAENMDRSETHTVDANEYYSFVRALETVR